MLQYIVVADVDDGVDVDSHRIHLTVVPNRLAHSYLDMEQRQHVNNLDDDDDDGTMVD